MPSSIRISLNRSTLLDRAYLDQIKGKSWTSKHWAGLHLQNLQESILDVNIRNEFKTLKNFTPEVTKFVEPFLTKFIQN
jgi:hypothetical protein